MSEYPVSRTAKMIATRKVSARRGITRAFDDGERGKGHVARMARTTTAI
jgi:hypothetical protein